jgi:hypothetical protein
MTDTNKTHQPSLVWPHEYSPPGHLRKDVDLQSQTFLCQLEELATGNSKHFHITPEELPEHQIWELIDIENTSLHAQKMFPARQHTNNLQLNDTPLTNSTLRGFTSLDMKYKPRSLPLIALDAPHIASESGYMKFIYQT